MTVVRSAAAPPVPDRVVHPARSPAAPRRRNPTLTDVGGRHCRRHGAGLESDGDDRGRRRRRCGRQPARTVGDVGGRRSPATTRSAKRTAVVTTVEVSLHGDDGAVTRIVGDLAERFAHMALTADGRLLAIAGESSGTVTVWDLTTGQAVGVPFTAGGPIARPRVRAGRIGTRREHRGVDHPRADRRHRRRSCWSTAAQGPLGPAAIAPDGSWIVVPVGERRRRSDRVVARRRASSIIDLPVADGLNAPRRVRVAERHPCRCGDRRRVPIRSRPCLAIWDVVNGTLTGTIPLVDGGGHRGGRSGPTTVCSSPTGRRRRCGARPGNSC